MEDNISDDNSLSDENNDTEEKQDNEFENMLKQVREEKNKKTSKEKKPKNFVSTVATRITAKPVTIHSDTEAVLLSRTFQRQLLLNCL